MGLGVLGLGLRGFWVWVFLVFWSWDQELYGFMVSIFFLALCCSFGCGVGIVQAKTTSASLCPKVSKFSAPA